MLDWVAIQPVLKTWAESYTQLPAVWEDEPLAWTPKALIKLNIITSTEHHTDAHGWEYSEDADEGAEMVPYVQGIRHFTVSIQCISRNQAPAHYARTHLERLRTSLPLESVRTAFHAVNISVRRALDVIARPRVVQRRRESWGVLDLQMQGGFRVLYPEQGVPYFDKIQSVTTYVNVDDTTRVFDRTIAQP